MSNLVATRARGRVSHLRPRRGVARVLVTLGGGVAVVALAHLAWIVTVLDTDVLYLGSGALLVEALRRTEAARPIGTP